MAIGSRLRHVVESQQFSRPLLEELLDRADEMKRQPHHFSGRLNGQVMAALFYEPSTRTRLSFEAAMLRLGGRTMGTDNAREFSSAAKGETLEDTIRIVSGYADLIVLRHNEEGAARRAAAVSSVPVINAGDGPASIRRRRCSTSTRSGTSSATSMASASRWSGTSPTAAPSGRWPTCSASSAISESALSRRLRWR